MEKIVGLYDSNGVVVNRIIIDTNNIYVPPVGLEIIDDPLSAIGDSVVNGTLVKQTQGE